MRHAGQPERNDQKNPFVHASGMGSPSCEGKKLSKKTCLTVSLRGECLPLDVLRRDTASCLQLHERSDVQH